MAEKQKEVDKVKSALMKDINRIRKQAEAQTRMNILRKHQLTLLNKFIKKLLKQGKISKKELKPYNPRKKDALRELFN